MKLLVCLSAFLVSCGSAELAEQLNKLSATPAPTEEAPGVVWTATPLPARSRESNEALQTKLVGQWDLYSRSCDGSEFSFDFSGNGTCYIFKKYGPRYKCSWSWIDEAQVKFCIGDNCRTDMFISFEGDLMTVHTSKCDTEYTRPEVK